jgi:hypothetical protein
MHYYLLLARNATIGSLFYYSIMNSVKNYYLSRTDCSTFYKTFIAHFFTRNILLNEGIVIGLLVGRYIQ